MTDQKYFHDDKDLSKSLKKKVNELYYLQKKRKLNNLQINDNDNDNFIFQKGCNYSLLNSKTILANINLQSEIEKGQQISQSDSINFGKNYLKNFELFKNENLEQNNKNKNLPISMNNNYIGFSVEKNVNENVENLSKDKLKESPINQISHCLNKNNYFNVVQEEKSEKKIYKKNVLNIENNNEIKALKNNKVVYINRDLLNSYSSSRNIKKINNITFFVEKNKRSSKYRGVSKNGYQFQVLMMVNNNKYYIGSYPSEELAARIYDVLAIKNRGTKARTNFAYNKNQIKKIYENEIDIKS